MWKSEVRRNIECCSLCANRSDSPSLLLHLFPFPGAAFFVPVMYSELLAPGGLKRLAVKRLCRDTDKSQALQVLTYDLTAAVSAAAESVMGSQPESHRVVCPPSRL
ncbi:hypothetical protein chiPu_0006643 [Chiloscyllium punctatum]|uniref:Uncharacterized protein n=1 Tax=Chiloscyllium punctatum TaxID=137246 RepID=A0A401SCY8_CHIPU|nr:hypothetical protein [Chiloscyllium punctatum]